MAAALCLTLGCQLIAAPIMLWGQEPTRPVPAEYPYLPGKTVAIAVWADSETSLTFPHVQLEIAEHLTQALREHVERLEFVGNRDIVRYQRRNLDWDREDPATLGAQLGADRFIVIELTQYTTREPESPQLYRGRIAANVKVYDTEYPRTQPAYKTPIEAVYPPDSAGKWGTSDSEIRKAAMEAFAEEFTNRFYERKVKL